MSVNPQEREQARQRKRRELERRKSGAPVARCGAKTRSGSCRNAAGWGTDHRGVARCRWYGGASPSGRQAAARQQAMQEVAAADRELELVDATDVLEIALALAHHRSVCFQERFAAQLDGGDLALVGVEGELIERAARIAKIALAEGLDDHQTRRLHRAAAALSAIFDAAIGAAPAELQPETRIRMVEIFKEGIERLGERTPSNALDGALGESAG